MATYSAAHVPGQDYFTIGSKDAAHLSSPVVPSAPRRVVPLQRTRLALFLAAMLLAIGALVAQVVLITHKWKGTVYVEFLFDYYYYDFSIRGKYFAKEPNLVIAVAAIACAFALTFFIMLFFPVMTASLAGAIVQVVLVPLVAMLWLAPVGVSAKTANVMLDSWWPKVWVVSNSIALGCECASFLVWATIVVLSIISLLRVVKAHKAARGAGQVYNGANAA